MDSLLDALGKLSREVQLPVSVVPVAEPLLAGLLIAGLALSLRSRKSAAGQKASSCSKGASSSQQEEHSTSCSEDVETDLKRLPRQPHLQGTLIPSTGLLVNNPPRSYAFENENCTGQFLPLHRPSFDRELDKSGDYPYGDHFKGRKRLWELRMQFKFKTPVEGSMLVGLELENYVPLNAATKRLMMLCVAGLRQVVGNDLYHSVGDDPREGSAPHEKPVFMMPLWACDQFIVTPEGETPPDLADPHFSAYGMRRADDLRTYLKEIAELKLVPGPTYTFAIWGISQFIEIIRWEIQKLIPFKPIDFDQFCGRPPVQVVLYALSPGEEGEKRHLQSRKKYFFRYVLWSSLRPPPAQKIRELIPQEGSLAAGRVQQVSAMADRSLLSRFFGCCVGDRPV